MDVEVLHVQLAPLAQRIIAAIEDDKKRPRWETEVPRDPTSVKMAPALTSDVLEVAHLIASHPDEVVPSIRTDAFCLDGAPRVHILDKVRAGSLLVADATAPLPLLRAAGFKPKEWSFSRPENLKVVAFADKVYGPAWNPETKTSGPNPDVVEAAAEFLQLERAAVVTRLREAEVLRSESPEAKDRILSYGSMRGTNSLISMRVRRLLVIRWFPNLASMAARARAWRLLLAVFSGRAGGAGLELLRGRFTSESERTTQDFLGQAWQRRGVHVPKDPVLGAVAEQERSEMIQAVGRLRAEMCPEEEFFVVVMDGWPVPGLIYDEVLTTKDGGPGGRPEFLELIADLHRRDGRTHKADDLAQEAADGRARRNAAVERRVDPLRRANRSRAAAARDHAVEDSKILADVRAGSPGISGRKTRLALGWGRSRHSRAKALLDKE